LYVDTPIQDSDRSYLVPRAKQHYSISLCMGGLTPCPDLVDDILDPAKHPDPNSPASILDLGCGSGIWTLEMVRTLLQHF
jgi:methylase of polypeptide subunit release factors